MIEKLLTVEEVAEVLRMEPDFVFGLVRSGELRAYRLGNALRVGRAALEEYLEGCAQGPRQPDSLRKAQQPDQAALNRSSANGHVSPPDFMLRRVPTYAGRTTVRVLGSVAEGASIWMGKARYPLKFSSEFFQNLLSRFRGQQVKVGTTFSGPEPGSLGEWIQKHRQIQMNPTYAIAGLLIAEGYAERPERGYIRFFDAREL